MLETCENWLGVVNSCVYPAHQTRKIYHVLPYSVNVKASGSFEFHWVRQCLVNIVKIRLKDLYTSEMTRK